MLYYGLEWHSLDSYFQFKEISAPGTPDSNEIRLYAKDSSGVSTLCYKNDAGTEICFPTSGSLVNTDGTGASGRLALWSDADTIIGSAKLLYSSGTNPNIQILSTDAAQFAQLSVGRVTSDIRVATAGAAGNWSDIALQSDGVVRADTLNLILTARNASGGIKFATGAADTLKAIISSAGYLGLNIAAPDFVIAITGDATTSATTNIAIRDRSATASGPGITLLKARGTAGTPTATNSGDTLGAIGFGGWTDADKHNAARIEANANSLWSATNAEAYLSFYTTPNASLTRAERFRITSGGLVGIGSTFGTTTVATGLEVRGGLLTGDSDASIRRTAADATSPNLLFRKTRGTVGTEAATQSADNIGTLAFQGWGTAFGNGALIRATASELWSGTAQGTFLNFHTTADGSTSVTERFRIGQSGQWGIGGATYGTAGNVFLSGGASAAPTWGSHDSVTGLTSGDGHTQYALLAGRSGGQILIGGTASGDDLTLKSTSNATKGHVIFGTTSSYDETNNVFGAQSLDPFAITARPGFLALSDTNAVMQLRSHGAAASLILVQSGRGTIASPAALQSADDLFAFNAYGQYDTTVGHLNLGAQISARATENFSSTAAGTRWQFSVVPNTTTTLTEVWRIDQDGTWQGVKSGGNSIVGGTGSGDNLTLSSTSHATKGTVVVSGIPLSTTEQGFRVGTQQDGSAARPAVMMIGESISSATNNIAALYLTTNFTGAGDGPLGCYAQPTFSPSANISVAYGFLGDPIFAPPTGVTITTAIGMFARTIYTGSVGAVTGGRGINVESPVNLSGGSLKPTNQYGIYINNQGLSGISTAIGIHIEAQANATNNYVFSLPSDATDPTGGGGAATGRIPCLIGGALRYIPYY